MSDLYVAVVCCGLFALFVALAALVRPIPALWLPDRVRAIRVCVVSFVVVIVANLLFHQPREIHSEPSRQKSESRPVDLGGILTRALGSLPSPNPTPSVEERELGQFLRTAMLTDAPRFHLSEFSSGVGTHGRCRFGRARDRGRNDAVITRVSSRLRIGKRCGIPVHARRTHSSQSRVSSHVRTHGLFPYGQTIMTMRIAHLVIVLLGWNMSHAASEIDHNATFCAAVGGQTEVQPHLPLLRWARRDCGGLRDRRRGV